MLNPETIYFVKKLETAKMSPLSPQHTQHNIQKNYNGINALFNLFYEQDHKLIKDYPKFVIYIARIS